MNSLINEPKKQKLQQEVNQLKVHRDLLKEYVALLQEFNASKARELGANQKYLNLKEEKKNAQDI